jgi:hypothetical protein
LGVKPGLNRKNQNRDRTLRQDSHVTFSGPGLSRSWPETAIWRHCRFCTEELLPDSPRSSKCIVCVTATRGVLPATSPLLEHRWTRRRSRTHTSFQSSSLKPRRSRPSAFCPMKILAASGGTSGDSQCRRCFSKASSVKLLVLISGWLTFLHARPRCRFCRTAFCPSIELSAR